MIISEANRIQQVGEYYFSGKLKEIQALRQQGRDIINLGIGSPDMSPSSEAVRILSTSARHAAAHGYQPYIGIPELRDAISGYLMQHYQVRFDPNTEVLPLMGSKEGILHTTLAFVNPGDLVLVPDPGYPTYSAVARLAEAEPLRYQLDKDSNWQIDFSYLENLPLEKVKLMWVNYPHMPTGAKGSIDDFKRLIELAEKFKFLLVNDNPYGQLFDDPMLSIFQAENSREVALELNSMSKSHNMAGWRIGWITGEFEYIRMILRVKSNMDSGMFLPIQRAAAKMLQSAPEWYSHLRTTYERRRRTAFRIFDVLECVYDKDQKGMFAWGRVPSSVSDAAAWSEEILEKAEVFITPGFIFGPSGNDYLRISLCSPEDILNEAMERITKMK